MRLRARSDKPRNKDKVHTHQWRPSDATMSLSAVVLIIAACIGGLALLPRVVHAQPENGRLEGRVTLRGSDSSLANATVSIEGSSLVARTDNSGRYVLFRVPPGPQVAVVRRLGYAPSRTPFTMPASGVRTLNVVLATSALQLEQLIVTADKSGRGRGELGTASVIDRNAIANQIASSLQGVLELVPGVVLQPPGLDGAAQFSLRALAAGGAAGAGAVSGPGAADIASAGTLIVLDGVPLSNNANLQSVGARGEIAPPASTAGGGVDLRRIPATVLERVEVIRGIPSARWGDLTQGAIIVDTRAAPAPPEFAGRFDPRTGEANLVGGRGFASERQALTLTGNLAQTEAARSLSSASTIRGAAQLAHRVQLGTAPGKQSGADGRTPLARLTLDTRIDWFQLKFDAPERPDIEVGRNSRQDDRGLRISERARLALGGGTLELTASFDGQSQYTNESRRLVRATTPFTDRLTEGRTIGTFVEGPFLGAYELRGAPRMLYTRLEWDRATPVARAGIAQTRAGIELRREWNQGAGFLFDIARPPQVGAFNGARGYDRPRSFEAVAPLVTSAAYADTRALIRRGLWVAETQVGVRGSVLHEGNWWSSSSRSAMLEPRITAQLAPRSWMRFSAGAGAVSKLPTVGQLYPATQYFDVVNVNRFTPNPAERLAVLTTFIRDPRNDELGLSRGFKREAGLELDGGARWGALNVTVFEDRIRGAVTLRRDASSLPRDRYRLADTATGSGQPGRIVDPPLFAEPVPIFLDRFVNGGRLDNRGVEYTVTFPVIPSLRTRLEASGATIETTFGSDERDLGSASRLADFTIDTAIKRVAVFNGATAVSRRSIVTWRLVHHQPELGLVLTGTVQQRLGERRRTITRNDSLSFIGFVTRSGEVIEVPEAERGRPEYADLRSARGGSSNSSFATPDDWIMSLQVVKSVFGDGRLSFYAFNVFDRFVTFSGGAARASPTTRFGAELTMPTAGLFGARR